jgi:hypothetical protein
MPTEMIQLDVTMSGNFTIKDPLPVDGIWAKMGLS